MVPQGPDATSGQPPDPTQPAAGPPLEAMTRTAYFVAFFDLADSLITARSLIRRSWITYRWDASPQQRH